MALNKSDTIIKIQLIILLQLIILFSLTPIKAKEPIVINNTSQEIISGTYKLISDGNNTVKELYYNEEGSSTLTLYFTFDQDVIITLSFIRDFIGFNQIEKNNLVIASIPVTINSSGFKEGKISTAYKIDKIEPDTASFYYITSQEIEKLPTETNSPSVREFVDLKSFFKNGTYVVLGEERNQFLLRSGFIIVGLLWTIFVALIIIIPVRFVFQKSKNKEE